MDETLINFYSKSEMEVNMGVKTIFVTIDGKISVLWMKMVYYVNLDVLSIFDQLIKSQESENHFFLNMVN